MDREREARAGAAISPGSSGEIDSIFLRLSMMRKQLATGHFYWLSCGAGSGRGARLVIFLR
jgi:hypothetical protein